MVASAHDVVLVDTDIGTLPVLAVNVLDRLGYVVSRASKQLDQVLATEKLDEQIGRDWWHHEYKVIVRWEEASTGVLVNVDIAEKKGGGSNLDCQKRCRQFLLQLQEDARRASSIAKKKQKSTVYGAARWGTEEDLKTAGYLTKQAHPTRLIIGKSQGGSEYISVPELSTYAHALVCGRTGVGKTRGFFIPNLVERLGTNMIITEATPGYEPGELYNLTSGWRKQAGHQIYSFNPADMTSTRINPVDRVRYASQNTKAKEAEKLADLIIINGERENAKVDPTWDRSEKQLLTSLILHAAATDPEIGHIGAIRWLLMSDVKKILSKSPSPLAQMEFDGWLGATSDNFRFGVYAGLMTKLNPWITDQLVALTEKTDIDLNVLKNQLFSFYLAVPSSSRDSKLVGSLMLNFLLDYLLDSRAEMKNPTALFLDEFTNFGRIANVASILSIIRKAKISMVLGFQNYHQLEMVYSHKEAQIIFDQPATQIHFRQKNFREAKQLSEALGKTTIEETVVTDAGRVQELLQARALATPDELINLENQVIVFTSNTWPLKLPILAPYAYSSTFEYPPPERSEHPISELVSQRGKPFIQPYQSNNQNQPDNTHEPNDVDQQRSNENESERRNDSDQRNIDKPEADDIWQV